MTSISRIVDPTVTFSFSAIPPAISRTLADGEIRSVARARVGLAGRRVRGDEQHLTGGVEPDDVERDQRVLHPELVRIVGVREEEQHAGRSPAGSRGTSGPAPAPRRCARAPPGRSRRRAGPRARLPAVRASAWARRRTRRRLSGSAASPKAAARSRTSNERAAGLRPSGRERQIPPASAGASSSVSYISSLRTRLYFLA